MIIYAGTYRDLTFMPIIIANTLIGIIQEMRSKSVLDKLSMMNAPETSVIRDGKEISLPSKDVVLDDIAIFHAGNQISADAVIIKKRNRSLPHIRRNSRNQLWSRICWICHR